MDIEFIITVGIAFVLFAVVGTYAGRKVKTKSDYYVYGRQAPTILVVGSLVASYLSTVAFMGEMGFAYDGYVIPLLTLCIMAGGGYVIGSLYFGRYLRRSEVLTMPEYFGIRFGSPALRLITALIVVFGIGAYLIAVNQGLGLLMEELFGIPYVAGIAIAVVVYGSFTLYAGSRGVLITDTMMFLIFTVSGALVAPFIFSRAGGWMTGLEKLATLPERPGALDWGGRIGEGAAFSSQANAVIWAFALGIVWFLVVGTSPWQVSRYQMARNEHTVVRSGLFAMLSYAGLYVILPFAAATVAVFDPNIEPSERVLIKLASEHEVIPLWLGTLVIVGIFSAALSSCSTFLSLVGFSVSNDIIPFIEEKWGRKGAGEAFSDKKALAIARAAMLGVAAVAFLLTIKPAPAILWIGYFAATIFACAWGILAFASVHWARVTRAGAIASVLAGVLSLLLVEALITWGGLVLPFWLDPAFIGIGSSVAGLVIGSLLTRPTETELDYRTRLLTPTEISLERAPRHEYVFSRNLALFAMGVGVLFTIVLLGWYYVAYSNAV